ncbi:RB1-inducible coiled-coil protein 1 isoform X4 [Diabrotica virgifera virgifera]|uniref:RB1-inducible coiled-coil protein 1 n=1 Tax=Diabrotica virgifera virgifera TaxID=50390 RepID=A0ABM5JIB8_DIAVI|nr:RB1-inducible coiled-coil protein 1 isoform X4 [Diabrotica virgifera virgifera]
MLHVFHVDSGRMMTFDMSLALESVDNLKRYVQEEFKIPAEKQVLLISGGECLDPKKRVCSYSAGTDTNPIFLFSKSIIESPIPPPPTGDYGSESDVDLKVQEHCDMPVTFGTVAKRAQLAQQLVELARKQLTVCENIVHDQHLQQQGWSAVVASLEDITFEFKKRADVFLKFFENYIDEREMHAKFLGLFNNDLRTLQRIPVLPVLLLKNPRLAITDSKTSEEDEESNTSQTSITGREVSIYDWMCGSDTMDKLYDHCCRGIEQFDKKVLKSISEDIAEMLKNADNVQMKEVKGLGERLFGLETLMREAKKYMKNQAELAQSFANNQNRASNTKDASVLPDLCMSHKKQLQMMAFNHTQICDIRRRCTRAKEELSINLYHRLKWVMYIEDHILETDNKLVIYNESLKRLTKHLIILEQVHKAPATYLCAVAEVVRRRTFSQHFLLWASELACHLLTIRNEEIVRRKEFQSRFQGHFLSSLFPGMDDLPPDFATQAPPMFDTGLPKLTQEDIDKLKQDLPDMAENLNVPDTSVLTNFFLLRSLTARKEEEIQDDKMGNEEVIKAVEEKLIQAVSDVGLASDLDRDILRGTGSEPCLTTATGLPHLKDLDRGCESETDTEEFEKVGQSPLELNFDKNIPSPRPRTQDASTSTEDNLQVSRSEHEKLKTVLRKLYQLARDAILQLRSEQAVLRTQIVANKDSASQYCDKIDSSWANLILFQQQQEKENLEVISKSYENVISELRKQVDVQNQQIEDLFNEKSALEGEIIVSCQDLNTNMEKLREENAKTIEDLQRLLEEKEAEKEKIAKETTDRLTRDYKAEIESIRSRFKLMTMERSPSDSSLEKSVDFSNLASNSPFLLQMKEKFEMDKERAVSEALLKEREKWEKLMAIRIRETETKFLEEKDISLQNLAKKITEEKDKQIDFLMEREKNLNLECIKYKSTIQQLAESEIESSDVELLKKISALQEEKDALAEELEKCRSQNVKAVDMSTSVAVCEAKVDVTTSPIKQKESKKSEPTPKGILSVESCKSGDRVIVGWDKEHENFRVVQEKQHLYFVHSDYLEGLGLEVIEGQPNKHFCIAEVLDKEYCYARKSDNRYKVPKSTKFFRVKVRPSISTLSRDTSVSQSLYQPFSTGEHSRMTQSQSAVSTTVEEMILEDTSSPVRTHPPIPERDETDGVGPELLEAVASVEETEATLVEQVEQQVVVHNAGAAKWPEHHFAEDSGIVENIDNVEQAMAAIDDTLTEIENENENCDRDCNKQVEVFREQHAYISSTWLEMMLSRVFTKSIQNHKDCIEQNAVRKME